MVLVGDKIPGGGMVMELCRGTTSGVARVGDYKGADAI